MSDPIEIKRIRSLLEGIPKVSKKETGIQKRDIGSEKAEVLNSKKKKTDNNPKQKHQKEPEERDPSNPSSDDPDHGIIDIII